MGRLDLSSKDRTLLHLHRTRTSGEGKEYPPDITQEGIARATGLRKTHVPRTVKRLEADGLVRSLKGYVRSKDRKLKVYIITPKGEEAVSDLEKRLFRRTVTISGKDGSREATIEEILKEESRYGIDLLDILNAIDDDDVVEISTLRFGKMRGRAWMFNVPPRRSFHGRENEMAALRSWMDDDTPMMVILGQVGMGKTALAVELCHGLEGMSVIWFPIPRDRQAESLCKTVEHFLLQLGMDGPVSTPRDLGILLNENPLLLVIDGYYEVEEEFVDLMAELAKALRKGGRGKVLVTSPTGTPSYSRFYTISELESGKIAQLMLGGVGNGAARSILGVDAEDENLRKIFLLTKHNPSWLEMIRDRDEEGLLRRTRLTREEIRLLFFWARGVADTTNANTKH